jgi:hypothetical protein
MNENSTKTCGVPSLYSNTQRLQVVSIGFAKLKKQVSNHNLLKKWPQGEIKNDKGEMNGL